MAEQPPGPRKKRRARDAGVHPLSQRLAWLASASILLVGLILAKPAFSSFLDQARDFWQHSLNADPLSLKSVLNGAPDLLTGWLVTFATLLALCWFALLLLSMLQTRFHISQRPNPRRGPLLSLFQASRWQRVGWRLLGASLIAVAGFLILIHGLEHSLERILDGSAESAGFDGRWLELLAALTGVLMLLALLDTVIERKLYAKDMRMTPAELRRERRSSGISPELRRAQRKRARKMARVAAVEPGDEVLAIVDRQRHILAVVAWNPAWPKPRIARFAIDQLAGPLASLERDSIPVVAEPALARRLFRSEPGLAVPADTLDELAVLLAEYPARLQHPH